MAEDRIPLRIRSSMLKSLVLLELAAHGPSHGYAIAKSLEEIMRGWKPSLGTLYRVIDELEQEGLIECRREEATGRQRKLCRLTERGAERLAEKIKTQLKTMTCFLRIVSSALTRLLEEYSCSNEEILSVVQGMEEVLREVEKKLRQTTPCQASRGAPLSSPQHS